MRKILLMALAAGVLAEIGGCSGCSASSPAVTVENGFALDQHAFRFANFDTEPIGSRLTPDRAVRLFGADAVCVDGQAASCIVRPEAQAWIDQVNESLVHGHSEGIAVLSALMFLGKVSPSDFGADTAGQLTLTPALAEEISLFAATQGLAQAHEADRKFDARGAVAFLATALAPGQQEAFRLLIAMRTPEGFKGGHAVVPFGLFPGEREGQYFLRIYDSNFPETERRIELDTVADTWSYEGSFDPENPRPYVGNPENGNLLYFSPVTPRLRTFTAPFAPGGATTLMATRAMVMVEGDGVAVGMRDGKIVEQGGQLLPLATDCTCKLPNETSNITVGGDGGNPWPKTVSVTAGGYGDTSTVNVSGPGVSVQASGVKGKDSVAVDSTGKTVTYSSGNDGTTTLTVTTTKADGGTTTVTVTVSKSVNSVQIDTSDPNNVKVLTDATQTGTTVTVKVTDTAKDGTTKTTTAQGTTTGKDIEVAVQPQAGTSTTNTNVAVDLCLNGKKDPQEGDVDCGSFCAGQPFGQRHDEPHCMPGSKCTVDGDCFGALAACIRGVCGYASCTDGLKNGEESDVDCGSSQCLCALGKVCTVDRNCQDGLDCISGACRGGVPHTLTIRGMEDPLDRVSVSGIIDGNYFKQTAAANPGGGDVTITLTAKHSLRVYNMGTNYGHLSCHLASNSEWLWTRPTGTTSPTGETNTLICVRTQASLEYDTQGTGCPYRQEMGDAGYLYFPSGPKVTVAAGGRAPYDVDIRRTITDTSTLGYFGTADAGYAYEVTVGPPNVAYAQVGTFYQQPTTLQYRFGCSAVSPTASTQVPQSGREVIKLSCTCDLLAGADAGTDAGPDAAVAGPDAGADAGRDAGPDAGPPGPDAGPDAGPDGGLPCTLDTDCPAKNCDCGTSSGNCAGQTGQCLGAKSVVSTPTTDGVTASGTFTVPATCTKLRVSAWGAAGGGGNSSSFPMPPVPTAGGAGGYVTGQLAVASGDVITVWVGNGGDNTPGAMGNEGIGSYAGTAANGGQGEGLGNDLSGGIGGGLTSVKQTGSATRVFSVPGGPGAGSVGIAEPAGGTGAGGATTMSGESAAFGSQSGGGGAGENGGSAGTGGMPGGPGAYGTLPSGLTSQVGSGGTPPATSSTDYGSCPSGTGTAPAIGGAGGNGCVVLRCVP